jgi:hypothetical protein
MATKKKSDATAGKAAEGTVSFNCKVCNQPKPLSEMRVLTRFFPLQIVCKDCEKVVR